MNNKIKLAVAGAVLSAASVANAGIIIPAGDWTLDVNGNVNAFATWSDADKTKGAAINGASSGGLASAEDQTGEGSSQEINTGLLPKILMPRSRFWLTTTGSQPKNPRQSCLSSKSAWGTTLQMIVSVI